MKVIQVIKQLNNTELGKGGTNDTYILIPNDLEINDIFEKENTFYRFKDKYTKEEIAIRNTVGREKRIVGLGPYYRAKGLCAGDEIIIEKHSGDNIENYIIHTNKKSNNLVLQKSKYGFEILTLDRLAWFKEQIIELKSNVTVEYLISERKRRDSPEKTDFYKVSIDGNNLIDIINGNDIVELKIQNEQINVLEFYGWKKYSFQMED